MSGKVPRPIGKSATRAARFRRFVEGERHRVDEVLQLYGDMPDCRRSTAIELDWLHCLHTGVNDVMEDLRNTDPDDAAFRRKMTRKHLARIVAVCEAWERRLE